MSSETKIECLKCGWEPDGFAYWACTCGNSWNTFDTRGKCLACGIQWEDTSCPACGHTTKHELWYTEPNQSPDKIDVGDVALLRRKEIIEGRLQGYGIKNRKITYLPYLRFWPDEFQTPYDVGCRILILWAVSYVAQNLDEKEVIKNWLKTTVLWDKLSGKERKLFEGEVSSHALLDFCWNIEACIVLLWAVNLIEDLPGLDSKMPDDALDELTEKLPIEENPDVFLGELAYRDKEGVFIENIVNEMITGYLRDLMLSGKKEKQVIDLTISFERHYALNWVRKFSGISEWEETDTST